VHFVARLPTLAASLAIAFSLSAVHAQTNHANEVARILASPAYKAAAAHIANEHTRIVDEGIKLTEIPAPPFKEAARAKEFLAMMRAAGIQDAKIDEEGNVLALRKGTHSDGKVVVVSAHLDTVFPEGTDVKVKRQGTRLAAPGIGDDTMSLSVLLAYVRAMQAANVKTRDDILFVGTVGEEGPGDLRGVRYLFNKGQYKDKIKAFFSVESGSVAGITNGGVGSKRYRVTFAGPGGHSFGAFGLVNPMFALGQAANEFSRIQVAASPKTTYSIGVIGGGTSVNSIPVDAWMEVDMRSESMPDLKRVEDRMLKIVQEAAEGENFARSTKEGRITATARLIGDRPAGNTAQTTDLVQYAKAAIEAGGYKLNTQWSSTDSNMPMSLGIPAITIGRGAPDKSGRSHSLDEWMDVEKEPMVKAVNTALSIVLAVVGME
jgi:acetylornithine deacetylase/succinyl-diaminopimelate desuccinylase-like protein